MIIEKLKRAAKDPRKAKKILQIWSGLFNGHFGFKKFIILSRSRTGSNMLISMLNSHPSIYAEGEIFSWLKGQSVDKILDRIYSKYPKYIKAVGFKIFYYHPQADQSGLVWQILKDIDDLHVIHLKRINILRTLLSRKIAGLTNAYQFDINKKIQRKNKICHFTEDELKKGFEKTRGWEDKFGHMFRSKAIIDVNYEDLVWHKQRELERIAELLNVKHTDLKTDLKKQNPENISNLITNYQSLKTKFMDTKWSCFFED